MSKLIDRKVVYRQESDRRHTLGDYKGDPAKVTVTVIDTFRETDDGDQFREVVLTSRTQDISGIDRKSRFKLKFPEEVRELRDGLHKQFLANGGEASMENVSYKAVDVGSSKRMVLWTFERGEIRIGVRGGRMKVKENLWMLENLAETLDFLLSTDGR